MKSTSKKSTGLLGGFDFQPIFSDQTLSRSEPKEEEVSQAKPNEAEQAQIKPSESTDSHAQPNEAQLRSIKPKQAKDSETQVSVPLRGKPSQSRLTPCQLPRKGELNIGVNGSWKSSPFGRAGAQRLRGFCGDKLQDGHRL